MSHEGKQGGKRKAAPAFVLSKKEKKAKAPAKKEAKKKSTKSKAVKINAAVQG